MASLAAPASALLANSDATSCVTTNISNSQTTGFKETNPFFLSLVTGSNALSAGGVLSAAAQDVGTQGVLDSSNVSTNLAISGNGFFVVSSDPVTQNISYTRAGHFYPDKVGNLKNISGLYLQGWATDEVGNILPGTATSDLSSLKTINVSQVSGLAKPTTNISLAANLPSEDAVGTVHTTTLTVYDSLGADHTMTITWTKTDMALGMNTWSASIACADILPGDLPNSGLEKGTIGSGDDYTANPLIVVFDGTGKPVSYDGIDTPPDIAITWNPATTGAAQSVISLDLGTVGTADGMKCAAGAYAAPTIQQDGRAFGTFKSVSINEDGIISAIYSNGQEIVLSRIALANFAAPNQLSAQTGNSWIQTDLSGSYVLDVPKSGSLGKVVSMALEKSTVDIASEMTKLIELQQHYTANTKSISTITQMFDALMAIKT